MRNIYAPGSTNQEHSCSLEHTQVMIVLAEAQIPFACAPASTNERYLCSQEHKCGIFVLPRAQMRDICAPGSAHTRYLCSLSTNEKCLCPREQKIFAMQVLFVMRNRVSSFPLRECKIPPLVPHVPKFCPNAAGENARAQSGH
jgi:hypothetical protein